MVLFGSVCGGWKGIEGEGGGAGGGGGRGGGGGGGSGSKKSNSWALRTEESVVPEADVSLHCDVTLLNRDIHFALD